MLRVGAVNHETPLTFTGKFIGPQFHHPMGVDIELP
jgi:hypothetical protein